MLSERYAALFPFSFSNTQSPPTRSLYSKQSKGTPASASAFTTTSPDEPAPMTQVFGTDFPTGAATLTR
jgi:hypothetical protein